MQPGYIPVYVESLLFAFIVPRSSTLVHVYGLVVVPGDDEVLGSLSNDPVVLMRVPVLA